MTASAPRYLVDLAYRPYLTGSTRLEGLVDAVLAVLENQATAYDQGNRIMATLADIKADADALVTASTATAATITGLQGQVADLTAKLAGGDPIVQSDLDAIDAELKTAATTLAPVVPTDPTDPTSTTDPIDQTPDPTAPTTTDPTPVDPAPAPLPPIVNPDPTVPPPAGVSAG